jgi:hypothetical protein
MNQQEEIVVVTNIEQYNKLAELDRTLIGTKAYFGIEWFGWNVWYKHTMRETTPEQKVKIHNMILGAGYGLSETNNVIGSIIKEVTGETVPSQEEIEKSKET